MDAARACIERGSPYPVAEMVEDYSDHIGERLQRARDRAGMSVEDVQFRTRIPKSVVIALEAADFSVFSSPTYAKSFLSQYSGFLKVDAQLWLDALQPANFLGGEFVNPLWQAPPEIEKELRPMPPAASGNWVATVALLLFSCGIVFAALRGYQLLESRFGMEISGSEITKIKESRLHSAKEVELPAQTSVSAEMNQLHADAASLSRQNAMAEPPPRAIIVR